MKADLVAARASVRDARTPASVFMERSLNVLVAPVCAHAFIAATPVESRHAAAAADRLVAEGRDPGPLAGLAVSIKDLFDVEGQVTAAGSALLAHEAPAAVDAPAVARLRAAGAAFVGRTNMSEFAFSGVGINPHHGTPANPATAAIDAQPRLPGGSTSGGAVSVAAGAAWAALGSDTGGSLRIPAALQGLVGFKSTARRVPTAGAFPLSTTLDTVGAITLSVRDAVVLHEILSCRRVPADPRPLSGWRLAVPQTLMLDGLDATVAAAFARTLSTLRARGAVIDVVELSLLGELATLNAAGGLSAAESWALHRQRLAQNEAAFDPRVARRIRRGEAMSAADYIDLVAARRDWIARLEAAASGFDALLSPTVPIVAPPIAPLIDDDEAFFAVNAQLLRNPAAVNFADGCAISLPCHHAGELPVGLMVWSTAMRDDAVLAIAAGIETALADDPVDAGRQAAAPPPHVRAA